MTTISSADLYTSIASDFHTYQPKRRITIPQNRGTRPIDVPIPCSNGSLPLDFNGRIAQKCYTPLARAGVFERLNFDMGSTLLDWMEVYQPEVYREITESDRRSREHYGGHGTALLLASFNHTILPLQKILLPSSNGHPQFDMSDVETQVIWAKESFKRHFGREPEGAWLPETAVDDDVLKVLVKQGIKFIVLSQEQAEKIRPISTDGHENSWEDKSQAPYLDPSRPYKVNLDDGSSIAVFFRDEEVSNSFAFGKAGVFDSSERFIQRWYEGKNYDRKHNQIIIQALDTEALGEHNGNGEKVASGAINMLKDGQMANLAQFLEHNPPEWEAKIKQGTSWSCIGHGLGHWGANEHCTCEYPVGGNSQWRVDFRNTFNFARDRMHELFQELGSELFIDPKAAKNEYINVIDTEPSDRYVAVLDSFLDKHLKPGVSKHHWGNTAYKLLEMEKFIQLMYTSCAWYWSDPNRIEPYISQVYLHTALGLYKDITGEPSVENEVINMLSSLRNSPETVAIYKGIFNNIHKNSNVSPTAQLMMA